MKIQLLEDISTDGKPCFFRIHCIPWATVLIRYITLVIVLLRAN
ncbi:hypothetical protein HMPREF3156_01169 [Neisseria sp. HMSC06F02]|nr:hypothetical protein HMPREF3156_01169 [Neisseria sp. HMSC06F02]